MADRWRRAGGDVTGKGGERVRATDVLESLIADCRWGFLLLLGIHVFFGLEVCVCCVFIGRRGTGRGYRYALSSIVGVWHDLGQPSTSKSWRVGGKSGRLGPHYCTGICTPICELGRLALGLPHAVPYSHKLTY